MNVAMVTPWYPNRESRYSGVFVREYAKAVQGLCNVVVVHCDLADASLPTRWAVEQEQDEQLTEGVFTYRARFRPCRLRRLSYPRYLTSVSQALRRISRTHGRLDLIHAHVHTAGSAALLAGRLLGVPVILSEHSSAFQRNLLSRIEILEARFVYRMANAVLPVSEALQATLVNAGMTARFQVVPNVVDTNLFTFHQRASVSSTELRLLAVSSLVENKGLHFLFEALAKVSWHGRAWRLDLIGGGPEEEKLKELARNLGLERHMCFHGQQSKAEIARAMQAADFFVLPSLVETFSVVTAEAMAAGLPVVVTRCGGPEGFVTNETGITAAPGDAQSLSEAITAMIDRLPHFNRPLISQQATQQFSADRIGSMLHEIYARSIRGGTASLKSNRSKTLVNSNPKAAQITSSSLRP